MKFRDLIFVCVGTYASLFACREDRSQADYPAEMPTPNSKTPVSNNANPPVPMDQNGKTEAPAPGSAQKDLSYNCKPILPCDAAAPAFGAKRPFKAASPLGQPYHRGHDLYLKEGETQWIVGSFRYGNVLLRQSLLNEEVDIYLLRGCGETWEKLGTATTTASAGTHPTIEGIEDEGGRIYFEIPAAKKLAVGRHRILLAVAGDQATTELFIEVIPNNKEIPFFVSDVDGTLTSSELAEVGGVILNRTVEAHEGAAEALNALVAKGYRPIYLTARAEMLVQRTREFLKERKFPPGRIETTLSSSFTGLTGEAAITFKSAALRRLTDRGFKILFGFGNTATDTNSYQSANIPVSGRYFYRFDDANFGGKRIESYLQLENFKNLKNTCVQ